MVLRSLVDARFQVLFHSAHGCAFHLSLTVLVHYRSPRSTEPWGVVPPDSSQVPRVWLYLGILSRKASLHLRACHPLWGGFPATSVSYAFVKPVPHRNGADSSHDTDRATLAGYHTRPV